MTTNQLHGLDQLVFSDICVASPANGSWFKKTPDSLLIEPVPQAMLEEVDRLYQKLALFPESDFQVRWESVETVIPMRVARIKTTRNADVFICRRYKLLPDSLSALGMPPLIASEFFEPSLQDGLIAIFGSTGSGKTTVAGTYVKERLRTLGGVCWAIEDPVELDLEGRHGAGVCYQIEAHSDEEISSAIKRLYRAAPNIIFIGECRDGHSIREGIAAALSGHLVLLTLHSGNLISGIDRMARLSGDKAADGLSQALRIAVHLELHNAEATQQFRELHNMGSPTGNPPRVLSVEALIVNSEGTKTVLRDGKFLQLKSEIDRQRRMFMARKAP